MTANSLSPLQQDSGHTGSGGDDANGASSDDGSLEMLEKLLKES